MKWISFGAMLWVCSLASMVGEAQSDPAPPGSLDLTEGWLFQPDPEGRGEAGGWHLPTFSPSDWVTLEAGKRWEEQGFPDLDGPAWYRRSFNVPAAWRDQPVWFVMGGVNDACVVFCNGQRINAFGSWEEVSPENHPGGCRTPGLHRTPVIVDLTSAIRYGQSNLVAVVFNDWGGSGGIVRLPCIVTNDPAALPLDSIVGIWTDYAAKQVNMDADLAGLGLDWPPDTVFRARITRPADGLLLEERRLSLAPPCADTITIDMPEVREGESLALQISAESPTGEPLAGLTISKTITWPSWPSWEGEYASLKVMNSFVTELLSLSAEPGAPLTFLNPRDGWCFLSVIPESAGAAPAPAATLDDETASLIWRMNPDTGAFEVMRHLPKGRHHLHLDLATPAQVNIRAVPLIAYCYYPATPHISAFGPYDWPYLERHVLPHVNTIITRGGVPERDKWVREGRHWIANAGLPGLKSPEPPAPEEVYAAWAATPAFTEPGYAGIMVDEFLSSTQGHYEAWNEAVQLVHADPRFAGQTFYAWCGDLFDDIHSRAFCRTLMDLGYGFSWEKYLNEQPTEAQARRYIQRCTQFPLVQWHQHMPGIEKHLVMCYGYLCAPPETSNIDPGVDYHRFLDMQFGLLANEPAFWGLHGIMEYTASYADEESLRYAHKLLRHYCIEGQRTPFNLDPYRLPHLVNPDFQTGLEGWQVDPAEEGSIDVGSMLGFKYLAGDFQPPGTEPDPFCRMIRSGERPNRLRQPLCSLQPGRPYSLKFISADINDLATKQLLTLSAEISDADIVEEYGFQEPFASCYSHELDPYGQGNPAYMNFHRMVFRPHKTEAMLTISDWAGSDDPGGPIGQSCVFNTVEVQPFHEP